MIRFKVIYIFAPFFFIIMKSIRSMRRLSWFCIFTNVDSAIQNAMTEFSAMKIHGVTPLYSLQFIFLVKISKSKPIADPLTVCSIGCCWSTVSPLVVDS